MDFPSSPEEARNWKPYIRHMALDVQVLVVAKSRVEGRWKAYIKNVPGYDHENEWQEVLKSGATLREDVARVLFPEFEDVPYAR